MFKLQCGIMVLRVPLWYSGLRIGVAVSCGVGRRRSSNLVVLWLWCRLAAAAPIRSLAWELPSAAGAALKSKKKKEIFTCGVKTL